MSEEINSTEALVERVLHGLLRERTADHAAIASQALTELAERLKAAEAKWYAAAPFRANWLQALEARDRAVAQRDELVVVLDTAWRYYPKDTPMSESMQIALAKVRG